MNKSEIQNHIKRLQNGRAATSDAHQIELIDLGLTKYRKMLAEIDQKKSDPQPLEKSEQLPQKPELEKWAKDIESSQLQEKAAEAVQEFESTMSRAGLLRPESNPVENESFRKSVSSVALTKQPAPTRPIKWADGKTVKEMNELDLRRKSVDYFNDVLNGKRLPADFYRSMQFNNLVRFQIGLYRFGNPIMAHMVLHPTYKMCEKKMQERSVELFRQVHDMWSQYKDTDIV